MKILQVIHDFLPKHQAGSEIYCWHLSRELQRLGHEVMLLFTEIDHDQSQYFLRRGEYDGLPFVEIVNNHSYSSFLQTYSNPAIDTIFAQVIHEYQPDVVHFHHLLGLSYGCVRICCEHGIPVVFTLHDYWLTCPRGGGQRFRGEGKLCHTVDTALCAECVSRFSFPVRTFQRFAKKIIHSLEILESPSLISNLQKGHIESPNPAFVSRGVWSEEGESSEMLYTHPPCRITIRQDIPKNSALIFSIAMAPSTYNQPGDGVLFQITCDRQIIYERFLHPKEKKEDRGRHAEKITLSPWVGRNRALVFETKAHPAGQIDFCTAGWIEPKIVSLDGDSYRPGMGSKLRLYTESILTRLQRKQLQKQVEARTRSTHELFHQVDLFIAPSRFLQTKFIEYGVPAERIVFSDYGIDSSKIILRTRKPMFPIRFTYIGTLVEHKGLHVLIQAFNGLPSPSAVLQVYGNPNEFTAYVSRIRSLIAHPGITLRGRIENTEIPRILSESDVLVVPSIWFENSPITIHEAFLAGVPVITSRFGGMEELVQDGINGLLFDVGNADDLRRCLLYCVESPDRLEALRLDPKSVKPMPADAEWMIQIYRSLSQKKKNS